MGFGYETSKSEGISLSLQHENTLIMSPLIKHLQLLVAENEISEALELMLAVKEANPQLRNSQLDENMIRIWQGQYSKLQRDVMAGVIDANREALSSNRLLRNVNQAIMKIPSSVEFPKGFGEGHAGGEGGISGGGNGDTAEGSLVNILMLTANPRGTVKLNLEREHARIHEELSGFHATYKLQPKYDVRVTELSKEIIKEKPEIVHFSGHGRSSKPQAADPSDPFAEPQPGEVGGLLVVNAAGDGLHSAPASALAFMFKSMMSHQEIPLKVVLLNACHSGEQAEAIAQHVPYVIGTSDEVLDEAAWVFSKGFYFSLADQAGTNLNEEAIRKAFNVGQMNAVFAGEPEDRFVLYVEGQQQ